MQITKEALERVADVKQGRLASEAMGRVTSATKTRLEYRLNKPRLDEIEAKLIQGTEKPQAIVKAPAKAIAKSKKAA